MSIKDVVYCNNKKVKFMKTLQKINDKTTKLWVSGYLKVVALFAPALTFLAPVKAMASQNVFQEVGTGQLGSDIDKVGGGSLDGEFKTTAQNWLNLIWVLGMIAGAFCVITGLMKLSSSKNTNQPTTGAWVTIGVGIALLAASPVAWILASRMKKAVGSTGTSTAK